MKKTLPCLSALATIIVASAAIAETASELPANSSQVPIQSATHTDADNIAVGDLRGTGLDATNVDLAAITGGDGDGAADTVIAQGTDQADDIDVGSNAGNVVVDGPSGHVAVAGNEAALDNVTVATLGGADTINAGVGFSGPIPVTVDGGDGSDTTTYSGTNADDTIGIARNGAAGSHASKRLPCPGLLCTFIAPSWSRTISPTVARPSPVPARRVVKNGSNKRRATPSVRPRPVSLTARHT